MGDKLTLVEWLEERCENCLMHAKGMGGKDRDGWLEDAYYFRLAISKLASLQPTLTVEQILSRCANKFVISRDAMRTLKHILPDIVRMSREGQEVVTPTLTEEADNGK